MTIRQVLVDSSTWTAITAPVDCNTVTLADAAGAVALKLRSTAADSTTEKSVAAAAQPYALGSRPVGSGRSMYAAGQVVIYVQAASGTPTVIATYA